MSQNPKGPSPTLDLMTRHRLQNLAKGRAPVLQLYKTEELVSLKVKGRDSVVQLQITITRSSALSVLGQELCLQLLEQETPLGHRHDSKKQLWKIQRHKPPCSNQEIKGYDQPQSTKIQVELNRFGSAWSLPALLIFHSRFVQLVS